MNNSRYRNYVFDFKGAMSLFVGLIIGIIILGIYISIYIFHELTLTQILNDKHLVDAKVQQLSSSMFFVILSYLSTVLFPILGFDVLMMKSNGKKLNFSMQSRPFHVYLLIFPMMFGMMMISEFFVSLIPVKGKIFEDLYNSFSEALSSMSTDTVGIYILTVLFAPVLEEILFRGIVQKGLINKGVKPMNAILISAFTFGVFHLNPWQSVNAFLLGLVLGVVYYKTKSLLMPILLHAFNNFISAYMLLNGNTESISENLHLPNYVGLIVGILIFSLFYYLFMYKNKVYFRE